MKRILMMLAGLLATAATPGFAAEIQFTEDFSLAKDRTVPLKQLIPGTKDYYYYHCLHYQNTEQFDKVEELLQAWIKRYKYTTRVREIQNRQALLTYEQNPVQSLEFIRKQLGILFNHQREDLNRRPNLATRLNQKLINRETLTKRAMARYKNLQGFENAAMDWLVAIPLNADRRRHLLSQLQRPDYANLPKLIVDDLNYKNSKGFGSFPIHRQLLLPQLEECLKLKPNLLNQTNFVRTYLTKLQPSADVDWRHSRQEHEAYLDRQWEFVQRLAPVHNSLKAHVLYQRLVLDRSHGIYDHDRFMTYVKLPRNVSYMNVKYLNLEQSRRYRANLQADYRAYTLFPIVGNDEPLVRSYLHRFFIKEATYKQYEPYLNDLYLKHNFAETKIVNGLGDPEQWYSMLPPAKYQALQRRIDLDFAYTNKKLFGADDLVSLDLHVKNVKTLIVKVYEINANNFYRENLREVDTNINLDGLVPNWERNETYQESPRRRVRRHFELPTLKNPGTYVVDFIGNGRSSRVLVRKGKLRYLARTTTAGHAFTVLDENNRKLNDATVWLDGHEYKPEEDGTISVPFSNRPGRRPIILSQGEFSSFDYFQHAAENLSLVAGIYVDRETLLKRKKARVVIRPALYLNGTPVTLSLLTDVTLVITSADHDNVATSKEVSGFELFEDRESIYEFQVPQRLSKISFTLKAKAQNLSQNKKVNLSASQSFALNEIDRTDKVEDLHLVSTDDGYAIDLLGKSGELKPSRPIQFSIKHRDFRNPVKLSLQTNVRGRVVLGMLTNIQWVRATGPQGTAHSWTLPKDQHTYHRLVHGQAGEPVELPYLGRRDEPARSELSLLELRGNSFVADRFDALTIQDGLIRLSDLPRGDYDLLLKDSGTRITVRLTEGERREGYVLSENRQLEVRDLRPLQIERIDVGEKAVAIRLQNASKFSRVHVFATRYLPAYSAYSNFSRVRDPEPYLITVPKADSVYLIGRNIGDEYRYIIDRKYAKKFPGNLLKRPSLLLNPWPIRKTATAKQEAQKGNSFDRTGAPGASKAERLSEKLPPAPGRGDFANLDFLTNASAVLLNLTPDEDGVVAINRDDLGDRQQIHVVAVDPLNTTYRTVSLPEVKSDHLDLRLLTGLNPKIHYTQQKQISVVKAKQKFLLSDITTSKFEAYDSLARVYALYVTLSNNPKLIEFGFILNWPKLKPEEKREKYSKYACHELNFFLFKKDPQFFRQVVQPYLLNKKDKTFLDSWLVDGDLSDSLDPWAHSQLNIVERILLGQRVDGELVFTSRHVKDLYDLLPPNIERFNHLYRTALKGSALDTGDNFGFGEAKKAQAAQRGAGKKLPAFGRRDLAELAAIPMPGKPSAKPSPSLSADSPPAAKSRKRALSRKASLQLKELERELVAKRVDPEKGKNKRLELADRLSRANEDLYYERAEELRKRVRQFYRKLDKTQEWVENNYYRLPIEQQNAKLITANAFWNEFAHHDPEQPFYSVNLAEASRNFPEMMFALSVLDLPFEAAEHDTDFENARMTLTPGSPMVVFHKEIKQAKAIADKTPILVSQNFFRHADRYRHVNNERLDKYVTDEFLVHVVYGCQVVVTNPTSSRQKLDVLLQVPVGAIPVLNGQYTRSVHIDLQPYHTQTIDYYFYFPAAGEYQHYPVHVAKNEQLIAHALPFTLNVVDELSEIDRESWVFISQHGSNADVLNYLKQHNLNRIDLSKIAFRMSNKAFFQTVVAILTQRHVYNHTLWSYAIKNDSVPAIREYLQHANSFVSRCGNFIESPLLTIDPVVRKTYQHMDYRPLVNSRAHQLGRRRQILNDRFSAQYHRLLKVLSYKRQLEDDDLMAVTYYMLLQDRVEQAQAFFTRVNAQNLTTRIQYDYFASHVDLYTDDHKLARGIAGKYSEHPVDHWRKAFASVISQMDEIDGQQVRLVDTEERTQVQTNLAATEPNFEFKVESKKIDLNYQNVDEILVNYYLMDVELLFSRNPFVQQYSGQFSHIRPNASQTIKLPEDETTVAFALPEQFHASNVLVEILAGGQTRSQAYYSHSLTAQIIENYGHTRVTDTKTGKPLSKVYVKVYAQRKDGSVKFYKDGYTDLRGRFDYTSLNKNELDFVKKFSLLVLSDEYGAVVREASPPKQ